MIVNINMIMHFLSVKRLAAANSEDKIPQNGQIPGNDGYFPKDKSCEMTITSVGFDKTMLN